MTQREALISLIRMYKKFEITLNNGFLRKVGGGCNVYKGLEQVANMVDEQTAVDVLLRVADEPSKGQNQH